MPKATEQMRSRAWTQTQVCVLWQPPKPSLLKSLSVTKKSFVQQAGSRKEQKHTQTPLNKRSLNLGIYKLNPFLLILASAPYLSLPLISFN